MPHLFMKTSMLTSSLTELFAFKKNYFRLGKLVVPGWSAWTSVTGYLHKKNQIVNLDITTYLNF